MDSSSFMDWLRGSMRSLTVWFGLIVATMPEWWPLIAEDVSWFAGDAWAPRIMRAVGVIIILLRFRTRLPVPEKATVAKARARGTTPQRRAEDGVIVDDDTLAEYERDAAQAPDPYRASMSENDAAKAAAKAAGQDARRWTDAGRPRGGA